MWTWTRLSVCPDEDDETERNTVPLTALASFFSDDDSLKQQKKKKPKKIKEGKIPKVKKRKKEVRSCSHTSPSVITKVCQEFWLKLCSLILSFPHYHSFVAFAIGSELCVGSWTASVIEMRSSGLPRALGRLAAESLLLPVWAVGAKCQFRVWIWACGAGA